MPRNLRDLSFATFNLLNLQVPGGLTYSNRPLFEDDAAGHAAYKRHVYYTHTYKAKRESLDHILVSEEFYDHSRKRRWSFREMEVYNDHLNRGAFEQDRASDHGLVRAHFDWYPMPAEIPADSPA